MGKGKKGASTPRRSSLSGASGRRAAAAAAAAGTEPAEGLHVNWGNDVADRQIPIDVPEELAHLATEERTLLIRSRLAKRASFGHILNDLTAATDDSNAATVSPTTPGHGLAAAAYSLADMAARKSAGMTAAAPSMPVIGTLPPEAAAGWPGNVAELAQAAAAAGVPLPVGPTVDAFGGGVSSTSLSALALAAAAAGLHPGVDPTAALSALQPHVGGQSAAVAAVAAAAGTAPNGGRPSAFELLRPDANTFSAAAAAAAAMTNWAKLQQQFNAASSTPAASMVTSPSTSTMATPLGSPLLSSLAKSSKAAPPSVTVMPPPAAATVSSAASPGTTAKSGGRGRQNSAQRNKGGGNTSANRAASAATVTTTQSTPSSSAKRHAAATDSVPLAPVPPPRGAAQVHGSATSNPSSTAASEVAVGSSNPADTVDLQSLSSLERKRRRLEKNKLAARECRKKKKHLMENMQLQHEVTLQENNFLRQQLIILADEMNRFERLVNQAAPTLLDQVGWNNSSIVGIATKTRRDLEARSMQGGGGAVHAELQSREVQTQVQAQARLMAAAAQAAMASGAGAGPAVSSAAAAAVAARVNASGNSRPQKRSVPNEGSDFDESSSDEEDMDNSLLAANV